MKIYRSETVVYSIRSNLLFKNIIQKNSIENNFYSVPAALLLYFTFPALQPLMGLGLLENFDPLRPITCYTMPASNSLRP